jgi:siderophore synthetase component
VLPRLYARAIERGEVVPLWGFRIPRGPSCRSGRWRPIHRRGECKHHLKTAVNLQLTGAVRTVSPNSAENAAPISRMLREIGDREGRFGSRFVVWRRGRPRTTIRRTARTPPKNAQSSRRTWP